MFNHGGLDISDHAYKYVQFKNGISGMKLAQYTRVSIPEGVIVHGEIKKPEDAAAALQTLVKSCNGMPRFVVTALPDTKTFIKRIDIAGNEDITPEIIRTELAKHIPLDVESLTIDWKEFAPPTQKKRPHTFEFFKQLLSHQNKQSPARSGTKRLFVAAAETDTVESYVKLLGTAKLIPLALEVEAQSIIRATLATFDTPPTATEAIVDIGATHTNIIFMEGEDVVFSTRTPYSGDGATAAIATKMNISLEKAEHAKLICGLDQTKCRGVVANVLTKSIQTLAEEIEKAKAFYTSHFQSDRQLARIILTGGGANLFEITTELSALLGIPVDRYDAQKNPRSPLHHLREIPKKDIVSYTTAIGLALRKAI